VSLERRGARTWGMGDRRTAPSLADNDIILMQVAHMFYYLAVVTETRSGRWLCFCRQDYEKYSFSPLAGNNGDGVASSGSG
jgi:hypothetical protein